MLAEVGDVISHLFLQQIDSRGATSWARPPKRSEKGRWKGAAPLGSLAASGGACEGPQGCLPSVPLTSSSLRFN